MSIAVKSGLPSLGSTEGAVITKDDISVTEETSPSASVGEDLPRGKSAYEIAKENGFNGTEAEWLASLKGEPGTPGAPGKDGTDGKTPYVGDNGNWYIGADDTGKPSRGAKGEPGLNGVTPTFSIESVETGEPGTDAEVTMTGDAPNHGLRFVIPRGDKGDPGATPNLTVGTVTTLEAGQNATASMGGTAESPVLNLGIPRGAKGEPGQGGGSAENAVLYTEQNLTNAQREQARANINAVGNEAIEFFNSEFKTHSEICKAYESGKVCYYPYAGTKLMNNGYSGRMQPFVFSGINGINEFLTVTVNTDDSVVMGDRGIYYLTEVPQATAESLGGVKADPATANDTQPVRIDSSGKLVTAAGSGSVDIVTSVSASSTDSEVPSAKCLYDLLGNVTALIDAM